uniref:Ribosomal protein S11 n=1 Tax=Campylaephora sungminbooi TaxID=1896769 RepID=A0A1B0ZER3_9FLOR|nr:ribosomal protein S11 [Campylaephora sungminbooi]ANP26201.1 ribosomal protein S11 [Campylaephora sungminbooi]ANP26222.1 ribosomal protein S11 [Campylaephora sungminbooi]WQF69657.1 ribosomal protein S11 [Campylaephora sungminbooi]
MNNFNSVILFIYFSINNVLFSITNLNGEVLAFFTVGTKRTKGIRKINLTTLKSTSSLINKNLKKNQIHIKIRGFSKFKRLTLKLLFKIIEAKILSFCDLTSLPHNGIRNKKNRRV